MGEKKTELTFDTKRFMKDIRAKCNAEGLRGMADECGVSASTLSRWDNGHLPGMEEFISVAEILMLRPGDYFVLSTWELKSRDVFEPF